MNTSRPLLITAAALVFTFVGCSSFNNNFNTYPPEKQLPTSAADILSDQIAIATNATQTVAVPVTDKGTMSPNLQCELSPFPATPAMPELPVNALQAAKTVEQMELIERKHIGDLRKYIAEAKDIRQKNQLEFFDKCAVVSKDKASK